MAFSHRIRPREERVFVVGEITIRVVGAQVQGTSGPRLSIDAPPHVRITPLPAGVGSGSGAGAGVGVGVGKEEVHRAEA